MEWNLKKLSLVLGRCRSFIDTSPQHLYCVLFDCELLTREKVFVKMFQVMINWQLISVQVYYWSQNSRSCWSCPVGNQLRDEFQRQMDIHFLSHKYTNYFTQLFNDSLSTFRAELSFATNQLMFIFRYSISERKFSNYSQHSCPN